MAPNMQFSIDDDSSVPKAVVSPSASYTTESSPLSPAEAESRRMMRHRSSAEKIIRGLKRMFSLEYELVDNEEDEETSNLTHTRNPGIICRRRERRLLLVVLGILLFALVSIFFLSSHIAGRRSSPISTGTAGGDHILYNTADGDQCLDPIASLKKSSFLEGLENGAVASDHPICSEVGNSILKDGGNAVDAAVATALCLGVANPASSGIGGGAFILVHSDRAHHEAKATDKDNSLAFRDARDASMPIAKGKITEVIDCREIAPNASTMEMYQDLDAHASSIGGLAIAVPGELRGLELVHSRHGKLPWASVVQPAIRLAREGVKITPHLAHDIEGVSEKIVRLDLGAFPKLRRFLTKDDNWNHNLKEGDLMQNTKLADTLETVAEKGSIGFYTGEHALNLVEEIQASGGLLTTDDMENYRPTLRSPLFAGDINGYTLLGVPPPSSGGATLIGAARFLAGYKSPLASTYDTLSAHRMVEALRHAFAIRMSLSDPAFNTNQTLSAVNDLMSGSYMESLRNATNDDATLPLSMYGGEKWAQLRDHDGQAEGSDAHEGDRRLGSPSRKLVRPFGYLEGA
jgi:gamma-glutamyltranspeptidase